MTRYGARAEAVRVYGNRRVSLGFDYRIVEPSVDPGIASNEIERLDQPYQVTSLVPTFFWDRRDDPLSPTRGWSSLAQVQYAFPVPAFRTDTEFLKLFVQQTGYYNLGRPGVLAASVRVGTIAPFKAIPTSGGVVLPFPSRNVPIAERFFAGGDATHRAYGRDELGIRGETLILNPNGGGYVPVAGRPAPLQPRIPLPGVRRFRRHGLLRQRQRLGRLALDLAGRAQERHRPGSALQLADRPHPRRHRLQAQPRARRVGLRAVREIGNPF